MLGRRAECVGGPLWSADWQRETDVCFFVFLFLFFFADRIDDDAPLAHTLLRSILISRIDGRRRSQP